MKGKLLIFMLCFSASVMFFTPLRTSAALEVVYGDVNGDGKINIKDLVSLRKYFVQYDPVSKTSEVNIEEGSDINCDDNIDLNDLTILKRYFANFNPITGTSSVTPGKMCSSGVYEGDSVISGGKASAMPGENVSVELNISSSDGIAAMLIYFDYDNDYLSLKKVNNKSDFMMTSGTAVLWDTYPNYIGNGSLAELVFEVSEDAPTGEYEIGISCYDASRYDKMDSVSTRIHTSSAFVTVGTDFDDQPAETLESGADELDYENAGNEDNSESVTDESDTAKDDLHTSEEITEVEGEEYDSAFETFESTVELFAEPEVSSGEPVMEGSLNNNETDEDKLPQTGMGTNLALFIIPAAIFLAVITGTKNNM